MSTHRDIAHPHPCHPRPIAVERLGNTAPAARRARPRRLLTALGLGTLCGLAAATLHAQSPPADADNQPPANAADKTPPASASAGMPTSRPAGVEPRHEPSPSEILDMLSPREGVARPIVRPSVPGRPVRTTVAPEGLPPNAVVPVESRLYPDGYRLVDRPGRLQREGDYFVFSFESRSTDKAEPPIRLLPNRMLEDMEIVSAGGTRPVVFLVSGETTEYHGVNYLLVQKMLIRPNLGNLK